MGLLERDDELARLRRHWQQARAGRGSVVLLTGEPGAGKTSLLQAFAQGTDLGAAPLWGSCDPLGTPRPLGPLHDVAGRLDESVRSALRDAAQPHEIFNAVSEFLRSIPSVLVIDDLHWADQATVDLLRFLLRRVATTSSLVIGALRDDEIGTAHPLRTLLGDVARSADATTIGLGALSLAAIARMAEGTGVDPYDVLRLTGGNPFFVTEMLEHAGDELPVSARDAILARTTTLGADAWDVLHLLSCAPEAIPDQLLSALRIGLPPLRAIDEAGLIRRGPRGVSFRHDLCRLAIASVIPPGGEAPLHRRMLDALEQSGGADPAVLAHHAIGAGDRWRITRHATAAGRAAARAGAHTQAAELFQIALERGAPVSTDEEAAILEALAVEHYLLDRLGDAIRASERALRLRRQRGDSVGVSANHHSLSVYHWYDANRDAAETHVGDAIAALAGVDIDDAPSELGHALAMQAYLALQQNDLATATPLVSRAATIGAATADAKLSVRSALISAICSIVGGEAAARDELLALLGSPDEHFDEIYSSGYSNLTYLDVEHRRLPEAAELLSRSLPLTVEREMPICRVWQTGSRARLALVRGDWQAAVADANEVLAAPSAPLARTWPLLVRGLVALRCRGGGHADLDDAVRLARRYREPIRLLPAIAALSERVWLTGAPDERIAAGRELVRDARPGLDWSRGELAVWLRRLDGTVDVGDLDGMAAPHHLELTGAHREAADLWAALGCPYEQALALVHSGDPDDARAGLDLLDRLGAEAVAARTRQALRATGVAAVPASRRATTRRNPSGLTGREIEVLHMLSGGLTNAELAERLYISVKTVDHHVSAILSKLGATNRRDAVRCARELGIV